MLKLGYETVVFLMPRPLTYESVHVEIKKSSFGV